MAVPPHVDEDDIIKGRDVFRSPEFRAFCRRFGIPYSLRTKSITIHLTLNDLTVDHVYYGTNGVPPPFAEDDQEDQEPDIEE